MTKIILLCSGGMSSSLLAMNMRKYAETIGYGVVIEAYAVSQAGSKAADADIILIGPQVRFNLDVVQKRLPDKPVALINMRDYGLMDGEAVIKQVINILIE